MPHGCGSQHAHHAPYNTRRLNYIPGYKNDRRLDLSTQSSVYICTRRRQAWDQHASKRLAANTHDPSKPRDARGLNTHSTAGCGGGRCRRSRAATLMGVGADQPGGVAVSRCQKPRSPGQVRLAAQSFSAWLSSQCCIDAMHGCSSITCPHHACGVSTRGGAQDPISEIQYRFAIMVRGTPHPGRHSTHLTLYNKTALHDSRRH